MGKIIRNHQINVGVIGLGVGEQHLISYIKSKLVNKIFVYDFKKSKQDSILKKYKNVIGCQSENEILLNKDIQAVSIASFDQYHYAQIISALRNNKNIFCEKPICTETFQLKKIFDLLKKKKKVMTTNTVLRVSPRFKKIKEKIQKSKFGRIYYIEADYNYGRRHKISKGWRGKIKDFSVVLSGGIHLIDLVLWYLKTEVSYVKSFSNNLCIKKDTIDDQVVSLIKFNNGVIVKLSCNFGCVYPHFHRLIIYGSNGTFEQSFSGSFFLEKTPKGLKKLKENTVYPGVNKGDMIENFLQAIVFKKKLIVSEEEMFNSMELCLKINKSLEINNEN